LGGYKVNGLGQLKGNRKKGEQAIYMNLLFVFLLFSLMVLSTNIFMNRTLNNRLKEHVDDTVNWIQTTISNALLTPELPFSYISENIQDMFRRGESLASIEDYMNLCSSTEYRDDMPGFMYNSIYGYFEDVDAF
jgi:hypothetical protein